MLGRCRRGFSHRLAAEIFIIERFAQRHKGVDFGFAVGRQPQPAVLLLQTFAGAGDKEIIFFLLHRQHIVFIFHRLAGIITQAVNNRGADIGEFLFLPHRAHIVERVLQALRPFFGRRAHVFHIHGGKLVEFEPVFFAAHIQRKFAHRHRIHLRGLALITGQIPGFEFQIGAAIGKAGLINGDAVQSERVVDAYGLLDFFAALFIGYHQIAGEILGHAGVVEINMKLFQFH